MEKEIKYKKQGNNQDSWEVKEYEILEVDKVLRTEEIKNAQGVVVFKQDIREIIGYEDLEKTKPIYAKELKRICVNAYMTDKKPN